MCLRFLFSAIIVFGMISCDSRVTELEEQKKAAEHKVQEAKEMQHAAEKAVEQKSEFEHALPAAADKQVELLGSVAVWGKEPGSMGDAQGIMVQLTNKDKGNMYTAFVEPGNSFKVTVVPGRYSLTINEPGYELHEEEITVDGRLNSQLLRPIGLKNLQ